MNEIIIRPATVKFLSKLIRPLTDTGVITMPEEKEIVAQLRHLSQKGTLLPAVAPKLIDTAEAAKMLGVQERSFRKQEKENQFPFKRKMIGTSVRFRNTDIIEYIMNDD